MGKITRIIFASGNGIARAPMAKAILEQMLKEKNRKMEVLCRGLLVQFPEPLNQKAEAIMISNGINWDNFESQEIKAEDITEQTLLFTMSESECQQLRERFEEATEENTFVLSSFVGDELETMDPYGGLLQAYGLCFEMLRESIKKLVEKLEEEAYE